MDHTAALCALALRHEPIIIVITGKSSSITREKFYEIIITCGEIYGTIEFTVIDWIPHEFGKFMSEQHPPLTYHAWAYLEASNEHCGLLTFNDDYIRTQYCRGKYDPDIIIAFGPLSDVMQRAEQRGVPVLRYD